MFRLALDFVFNSRLFVPTHRVSDFRKIAEIVRQNNTQFIIFDKDDTLTKLKQFSIGDEGIKTTVDQLKSMKVMLKILSNSIKPQDPREMEGIQILRTSKKKPFNEEEVNQLIHKFKPDQVMIVGDRLMTDIYLANKLNVKSILVPPVQSSTINKHGLPVTVLRLVQNLFLRMKAKY